jgi:hypothetical protein
MARAARDPSSNKSKERAVALRKKLQEAYERGATSEGTHFLVDQFVQLRKTYDQQLKALKKQAGF